MVTEIEKKSIIQAATLSRFCLLLSFILSVTFTVTAKLLATHVLAVLCGGICSLIELEFSQLLFRTYFCNDLNSNL